MSTKLTIDYSKKPSICPYEIVEHPNRTDTVEIDVSQIELANVLTKKETWIKGHEVLRRLKKEKGVLLDARIAEELLKHQELIPESWNDKVIYFWGTIFKHSDGGLCVAYLCRRDRGWGGGWGWLGNDWGSDGPAARLASMPSESKKLGSSLTLNPLDLTGYAIEIKLGGKRYKSTLEQIND